MSRPPRDAPFGLRSTLAPAFLALLLAAASALPARAAVRLDPLQTDSGTYRVYFRDRLLGTEKFTFKNSGDSLLVESDVDQKLPGPKGDEPLVKKATMILKLIDYGLVNYVSEQKFLGQSLQRAINVSDTVFTAYREVFPAGSAETFLRPPGRMFVIDSQVFALFDVMLRSLHGRLEGERPMAVVVLGEPRDTVLDIRIAPGATESITLAGVARNARRVGLSDGESEFLVWLSPEGRMLRLTQPATGLRVDRELAAPKRRPAATGTKPTSASPAAKPASQAAKPAPSKPPATPPKTSAPTGR
jgi:hypothetical protein